MFSFLIPDAQNRRVFDPASPLDYVASSVPVLCLFQAIKFAFDQPKSLPVRAARLLLFPFGVLATFLFCTTYDISLGISEHNGYNCALGLAGFTLSMKLAEMTFLSHRPKWIPVRASKARLKKDDEVESGEDVKDHHFSPMNGCPVEAEARAATWRDVLHYMCDPRGITYDFGQSAFKAPDPRDVNNRRSFLLQTARQAITDLLLIDIAQTFIQSIPGTTVGTPQGGSIYPIGVSTPIRYLVSTTLTITTGAMVYYGMDMGHCCFVLGSVGLFGQDPIEHPPLFWKPTRASSLRELWGKRWHPLFRQEFTALGWTIGKMVLGNAGGLLGVFLLSGLLHDIGIWPMGKGTDPARIVGFFYVQGIGIGLEGMWRKVTGKKVRGTWGRIWVWSWMTVTSHWVIEAWLQRGLAGVRLYLSDNHRPVLLLRNCLMRYYATLRQ